MRHVFKLGLKIEKNLHSSSITLFLENIFVKFKNYWTRTISTTISASNVLGYFYFAVKMINIIFHTFGTRYKWPKGWGDTEVLFQEWWISAPFNPHPPYHHTPSPVPVIKDVSNLTPTAMMAKCCRSAAFSLH